MMDFDLSPMPLFWCACRTDVPFCCKIQHLTIEDMFWERKLSWMDVALFLLLWPRHGHHVISTFCYHIFLNWYLLINALSVIAPCPSFFFYDQGLHVYKNYYIFLLNFLAVFGNFMLYWCLDLFIAWFPRRCYSAEIIVAFDIHVHLFGL